MNKDSIELKKSDAVGLLASSWIGAVLLAGGGSGVLIRLGMAERWALTIAFLAAGLLLYPVICAMAAVRGKDAPGPLRWASIWSGSVIAGFVVIYPLVSGALDSLF